jgi:hypothetical protein
MCALAQLLAHTISLVGSYASISIDPAVSWSVPYGRGGGNKKMDGENKLKRW